MAGGGGRDRMNPNPRKPPYGGPLAGSPGNSGPYVPDQPGAGTQKPNPQVRPQRPQRPPILQGPPVGPMTQTPPFVPGMPVAKPPMPNVDILQAEKPQVSGPLPSTPGKPAWQILREAGMPVGGSAAANRAAVRGLPGAGASGAGGDGRPGGIDGAIQALRAQLGQPFGGPSAVGQAVQSTSPGFWTPDRIAQANANTAAGTFGGQVNSGPFALPKPPSGLGGPGSDLGFQSGGGFLAPTFPPGDGSGQPQNPYLDLLRQRLAGSPGATIPNATQFGTPAAVAAGIGRYAY